MAMGSGARGEADSIVDISKPFVPFKEAAAGTGPFVLVKNPVKFSQDWTFQQGAGQAPIFPILAIQLFFSPVYQQFIELLEQVRPKLTGRLPKDFESARTSKGLVELARNIRELFESDPRLMEDMLKAFRHAGPRLTKVKNFKQLEALIKVFFFNDTATTEIYTLSLHDALPISSAFRASSSAVDSAAGCSVSTSVSAVVLPQEIGRAHV